MAAAESNAVRTARRRAGLTQLELAVRAHLSIETVAIAERGGRLSPRTAERLAQALGTNALRRAKGRS